MKTEREEIIEAVEKINGELYDRHEKLGNIDLLPDLGVSFYSYATTIQLSIVSEYQIPEIPIWCSEDDDRIFYEETETYESFYDYIKRKFEVIKNEINKIEL